MFEVLKHEGYNPHMTPETLEEENPYERMSPSERQQELARLLHVLPHQLIEGEAQIVENVRLLNDLANLLKFSKGTPEFISHQLWEAAHATEFGVEALKEKPEAVVPETAMFPGSVLVDVGVAGQFNDATVQIPEQRELLRLGRRRAAQRVSHDHLLFVGWSTSYENKYHQAPIDTLFLERDLPR